MKKVLLSVVMLLALMSPSAFAERPRGVEEYTNIDDLSAAIIGYFPRVQGEVESVRGDSITISLGRKHGLAEGMVLSLWRAGRELRHPITRAVMGREEEPVGRIEVVAAGESSSTATIRSKEKEPRPGDIARITPKKIRFAVIPVRTDQPDIIKDLSERLEDSGRFALLEPETRDAFLGGRALKDSELVKEMGREFGLDAAVTVGIYPSDGKYLATVKVFYAPDGKLLDTVVARLDLDGKKSALGMVRPFFAPAATGPVLSPALPFLSGIVAAADLDGDGELEYAFSDGSRVHVFREELSGWREIWMELPAEEDGTIKHLALSTADINGNGRPELFLTFRRDQSVSTVILESHEGSYRRIAEIGGFARVVTVPGRGEMLIGQVVDAGTVGAPRQYAWTGKEYRPGAEFPLPPGIGLYQFALAPGEGPEPVMIALDASERLLVYAGGKEIWRSSEQYEGSVVEIASSGNSKGGRRPVLRGRLLTADVTGDGRMEVLVSRKTDKSFWKGQSRSEIVALRWDGSRLERSWEAKDLSGLVQDLTTLRSASGSVRVKVLVRETGGLFSKDKGRVLTFGGK